MAYTPRVATQTMETIDAAIYKDQGQKFRGFLREHILDVDDAYDSSHHDRFRSHMGVSSSGRECARELWYSWRWAAPIAIGGRVLRLFNRGHLEEARFVAMLRLIGCNVWQAEEEGKQFRVSMFGGHYGSAIDGVVQGIPEMPDVPLLAEFKTHNEKSFNKLSGINSKGEQKDPPEGVKKSKIEHYVQMVQYMKYFELDFGLYGAVHKDSDRLYFEIIPRDDECADHFIDRSKRIILTQDAPPKISDNANFWKCNYCDKKRVCHFDETPDFNCRTCEASQARLDGTWYCRTHEIILDKERQLSGCPDWQKHHDLGSVIK